MGAQSTGTKRRHRSKQERRQIVEGSLKAGASVARIAESYGLRRNQIFHWRKLYREGRLGAATPELLPVRIAETAPHSGHIQVEFSRVRLSVEGSVDHESLRIILEHIAR
jgi:transposase